eukprot:8400273-Lingulodinium_polyedra.AAC.2
MPGGPRAGPDEESGGVPPPALRPALPRQPARGHAPGRKCTRRAASESAEPNSASPHAGRGRVDGAAEVPGPRVRTGDPTALGR